MKGLVTVTKIMITETGHRLINYDGKCAHLHGHRYEWHVTVGTRGANDLGEEGMVIDFADLKAKMKEVIGPYDHAMLLNREDPLVINRPEEEYRVLLRATNGEPPRIFLFPFNPTAENLAAEVGEKLSLAFGGTDINVINVTVWETENSYAEWEPDWLQDEE